VRGLIEDMFKGHNCSVFAYGSTGSGKTFTISGGAMKENGILQQAVTTIRQRLI
jgi:excinuclease UvrABC helicase subunit UvrB